jgi:Na+-driven multidrug efflux pump
MFISRFVAEFGAKAIAVQRIGTQVESLSWLIAGGFSTSLTAYFGQNFGSGKWSRISKGFRIALGVMAVWGVIITTALFFGAEIFYYIFLPDDREVIQMGVEYLRILSVCQIAMCLEGISAGAFRGLGKTVYPSIASVATNFTRVFAAYYLSRPEVLGLNGIWWAFSVGGCVRGFWIFLWYVKFSKKNPKQDLEINK